MSTSPKADKKTDIPVLQQPAADTLSNDVVDELDIPILTTPAEADKTDEKS